MKIEEKNGVFMILADDHETFWSYQVIDPSDPRVNRPKIKDVLKDWWDTTAPGEWTTTYSKNFEKAIVIRDARLFQLFKLAWTGRPEIHRAVTTMQEFAAYYCPYIPIKIIRAKDDDNI